MVSTRQMTIGNNGATENPEQNEPGPARSTRYSAGAITNQVQCTKFNTNFLDLPQEVIEKVFGYLTFKNVCQLRFVCTRFDQICSHRLNTTFQRLQHNLLQRFQEIKRKMPRRESARRNHHLACESDIIETLHMRLTLLQMSLGKHIERKHCCFFPGEILDEVMHILNYIKVTPKLGRPYKVTDELFDLSTMAMEYFKEKIEPDLPEIAYFSTDFFDFSNNFASTSTKSYLGIDSFPLDMEEGKDEAPSPEVPPPEDSPEAPPPQPCSSPSTTTNNNVLRKGIRIIKQGMKRYNSQLSILRQDVRSCRQKATEQQKLMSEQQKQMAEQQKQIVEFATRMDENDKKNEEISRKFSTLLQELNKCKTELQYWRSKSPATPLMCGSCGNAVLPNHEELEALVNQGVNPEGLCLESLEFVPIAGSSTEFSVASEVDADAPTEQAKDACNVPSMAGKSTKRKLEETKETPTRAPRSKKSRRVIKGRNKRAKV